MPNDAVTAVVEIETSPVEAVSWDEYPSPQVLLLMHPNSRIVQVASNQTYASPLQTQPHLVLNFYKKFFAIPATVPNAEPIPPNPPDIPGNDDPPSKSLAPPLE